MMIPAAVGAALLAPFPDVELLALPLLARRTPRGLGVTPLAVIAGVAAAASIAAGLKALFTGRKGPVQKQEATRIVNEAERYLQANLEQFLAGDHTTWDKAQALANFDYAWQQTVNLLSDPALGDAGKRGISERSRGGQWDWFTYYRDPIQETPASSADGAETLLESAGVSGSWLPVLALAALAVGVLA